MGFEPTTLRDLALMQNDISRANFTIKPLFEDVNCKFNRRQVPKTSKIERISSSKRHENARGW